MFDPTEFTVACEEGRTTLTPTEFRLLASLAASPGATVPARELIYSAWPHGAIVHDNTLDVYIARLRRKLREIEATDTSATVHGVGYKLECDALGLFGLRARIWVTVLAALTVVLIGSDRRLQPRARRRGSTPRPTAWRAPARRRNSTGCA